jgi:hypothetical protein
MDFALRANGFIHQRDQLLDSSIGDIERMQSKATLSGKTLDRSINLSVATP